MKDNEILILLSEDAEEWYQETCTCSFCRCDFMADEPKFCPGCGKKIIGYKQGKITIYYGKGDKE